MVDESGDLLAGEAEGEEFEEDAVGGAHYPPRTHSPHLKSWISFTFLIINLPLKKLTAYVNESSGQNFKKLSSLCLSFKKISIMNSPRRPLFSEIKPGKLHAFNGIPVGVPRYTTTIAIPKTSTKTTVCQ